MRVPYDMLREWCAPEVSLEELEHLLTLSGTKVEAIHHHGVPSEDGFVVGKVLEASQHPDADRLRVCRVDVGGGDPAQIVCGAPNVAAGQTVAVVRPGAVMPGGMKIKKAKLRGVESFGMILSERELQLSDEHTGILVLEDDGLAPGTPLAEVLPISTPVVEFEITPNRPDCLGVYGIAREVHAATGAPLAPAPWADDAAGVGGSDPPGLHVRIEAPDLCPRFTARVFEDVTIGPSPSWLKARLMAAGMRPINNVVDITNYVMLLTGHPLHAFDLDRVAGGELTVRRARDGEQVTTLDDQVRTLDPEMLVIEDAEGPTSIAGVMGGARSEVHDGTTRVAMEVASWIGHNILRTSNALGLRSEASGRFEKGLAPEQALEAQIVATRLMLELTGAKLVGGTLDVGPFATQPWERPTIRLRERKVQALLGMPIPRARQEQLLVALGFGVDTTPADGLDVTVPGFRRYDVTREADLVEEVGRFDLEQLPSTLPKRRDTAGHLPEALRRRRRAVDALVGRGAYEVVGWSFTEPGVADRLRLAEDDPHGRRDFVALQNPMSADHSVLRTTLLGSLLDAARHNVARGQTELSLFEHGAVYFARKGEQLPLEVHALGGLVHTAQGSRWGKTPFFAAKALLEAVFHALRVELSVEPVAQPFAWPGRSVAVLAGGDRVGWLAELHPHVTEEWELRLPAAAFEVDLDAVVRNGVAVPRYEDLTSFPPVRRDLALLAPRELAAADLLRVVRGAGRPLLRAAEVFDVYTGEQVGDERKSLALHLEFGAGDRTLTDDEVEDVVAKIIVKAHDELGATPRG